MGNESVVWPRRVIGLSNVDEEDDDDDDEFHNRRTSLPPDKSHSCACPFRLTTQPIYIYS